MAPRLYSTDREGWVAAEDLQVGESLRTHDGIATIERIETDGGTRRVYNLDVQSDHCFYVGDASVLGHNTNACPIRGYTEHGMNQAISRDGHGVSIRSILDAVTNPRRVTTQSRGRSMYVGRDATVVTNRDGKIITTWPNGSRGWRY